MLLQEARKTAVGRIGNPEEIAHVVSYLASPESAFVTGQTVPSNSS